MRVLIAAIGKAAAGPEADLVQRYADRIRKAGRALGITTLDLRELPESRAADVARRKQEEADSLLALVPAGFAVVVLDERGENLGSEAIAARFDKWRQSGVPGVAFLLGGPDGHGPAVSARADLKLAFGAATWPHLLARVLVAEQLYRVVTLLSGHPYHRA